MASKLSTLYPGKIDIDANNPFGTFKNRDDDILKNGTPYEKGWTSDVWGFLAHVLNKANIIPNSVEENINTSQYYDAFEQLLGNKEVQTESKNLVFDLLSATQVKADAVRLSTLDSLFQPSFIDDFDTTYVMPTDLMPGTLEKSSTWYQMWVDKEEVQLLVPDLIGTTDGTGAGFLIDSGNTFFTDKVKAGDRVRNTTDGTETTVSVTPTVDGANLAIADDIFVSGENYEIRLLTPEGLDDSKSLIGQVYNDGSGDFTIAHKYAGEIELYLNDENEQYSGQAANEEILKSGGDWIKNQCTAWVMFDGTATPPTITSSYNVSSVARLFTAVYEINFATPMDNANYVIAGSEAGNFQYMTGYTTANTTTKASISWVDFNGSRSSTIAFVMFFGGKN